VFHALSLPHIQQIIRLMLDKINKQLTERGHRARPHAAAETVLVDKGYDPQYESAPTAAHDPEKHIEDPLARGNRARAGARERSDRSGHRGRAVRLPRGPGADAPLELAEH